MPNVIRGNANEITHLTEGSIKLVLVGPVISKQPAVGLTITASFPKDRSNPIMDGDRPTLTAFSAAIRLTTDPQGVGCPVNILCPQLK